MWPPLPKLRQGLALHTWSPPPTWLMLVDGSTPASWRDRVHFQSSGTGEDPQPYPAALSHSLCSFPSHGLGDRCRNWGTLRLREDPAG